MKATELMVGDWVFTRGQIEQVTSIYDGYICTEHYEDSHDYYFEPIPLTPEILEKNGFAKENEDELKITYYFLERPYTTQITLYKEPIGDVSILFKAWGRVPSSAGGVNDIHLCSVKYVHEMQHAMRLCGIEKEIVL